MQSPRAEPIVKIASGGMATVYLGALRGALGFRTLVAIKKPHPHLLDDPRFRRTLLEEARLSAEIHHANVVDVRDVEEVGDAVHLVMDYVEGGSLGDLIAAWARGGLPLPPGVAVRILLDACAGLHAAHELTDSAGRSRGLVHRDVSPANILVGTDGVARVTDFGIAKCARDDGRPTTTDGALKGKVGYMAPEYIKGGAVDRRIDVFALGVVAWEALVGKRLFKGESDVDTLERVLRGEVPAVSTAAPSVGPAFDDVIARAVARDPAERFATAEALGAALHAAALAAGLLATHAEVGAHVRALFAESLEARRRAVDATTFDGPTLPDRAAPASPKRRSRAAIAIVAAAAAIAGSIAYGKLRAPASAPAPTSASASTPAPAPPPPSTPAPTPTSAPTFASASASASASAPTPARSPKPASGPKHPPPNPYPR